jgi:hypothetical protein
MPVCALVAHRSALAVGHWRCVHDACKRNEIRGSPRESKGRPHFGDARSQPESDTGESPAPAAPLPFDQHPWFPGQPAEPVRFLDPWREARRNAFAFVPAVSVACAGGAGA